MSNTDTEALDRLIRIRSGLILSNPFFGALALRLKLIEAKIVFDGEQLRRNTCATDGTRFLYNPEFIDTLTDAELRGVFCHEILHCALGHPWRIGERDPGTFGKACDYAINPILVDQKFTLPGKDSSGLLRKEFEGWDAEKIYHQILVENPPQPKGGKGKDKGGKGDQKGEGDGEGEGEGEGQGKGQGKGKGKGQGQGGGQQPQDGQGEGGGDGPQGEVPWGAIVPPEQPLEAAEQEAEWKVATAQAATIAKMQGTLPAQLERLVEEALRNKVDWKSALRRFMQQQARADYSWRLPNRRYQSQGFYMPSLLSETMPPVVIVVDTSGSIGQNELNVFAKEITSIMDECKPELIHVVYCDARVAHTQEFQPGDPINLEARGGGGTDFRPPFIWVEKEDIQPACLIYLTDTYGTFPDSPPDYPVIWAVTVKDKECPFGETLYIGDDLE